MTWLQCVTLLSSLIPCVQYNLNRQQQRVRFFGFWAYVLIIKMYKVFMTRKQIPTLALIAVGSRTRILACKTTNNGFL